MADDKNKLFDISLPDFLLGFTLGLLCSSASNDQKARKRRVHTSKRFRRRNRLSESEQQIRDEIDNYDSPRPIQTPGQA
jgi:hypothetical protein